MATFGRYVAAPVIWGVWMVGFAVFQQVVHIVRPLAKELDTGGHMTEAIAWMTVVEDEWVLVGLIGVFISVLATGVVTRGVGT